MTHFKAHYTDHSLNATADYAVRLQVAAESLERRLVGLPDCALLIDDISGQLAKVRATLAMVERMEQRQ